jgi:diadenylate cyclase
MVKDMQYLAIIEHLRVADVVDILFLSVVVYYLYIWFRGTNAFKALVGLLGLGIIYTVARTWGLFLTTWAFQFLWQVLVILLIILFQSEIRQVLERVNPLRFIGFHMLAGAEDWIPGFVQVIFDMAKGRIGALVILERSDRTDEWMTACIPLRSKPAPEILRSIFQKESALHDGAVLIRENSLVSTSCYLPLSPDEGLPQEWGTRHRAALGLSQRCDAWVVVVSEERGEVSLAREGKMHHVENATRLSQFIHEALSSPGRPQISWMTRTRSLVLNRWPAKLGTLALVSVVWLLLAGEQNFQVTLNVPLEVINLPDRLEIVEPLGPKIRVTLQGLRKDASILTDSNVHAELDLSIAHAGSRIYDVGREDIKLPDDQVRIVNVEPSRLKFTFKTKSP